MRQDYLPPEVGWREAMRMAGMDAGDLRGLGWRGWLEAAAAVAAAFSIAWMLAAIV